MICHRCRQPLAPDLRFCEHCGTPVPQPSGLTNFTRVRQLFDHAIELPPQDRLAWLKQQCGQDEALLSQLAAMLPPGNDSFLAAPATPPPSLIYPGAQPPLSPPPPLAVPSAPAPSNPNPSAHFIGPYRIVKRLGQGGMGIVFLAVRDDGAFRKNVALKLLLRDKVTPEFIQRFKTERQVLAALDHPNIARILDGGDTPDGMPYYVMEYVQGAAVDAYCFQQQLPLNTRIGIFLQICAAVEYLHQNSILHRDLKPANILVSSEGTVKLLDFGIAKMVGAAAVSNPDLTSVQGIPMTLSYASPEQIGGLPVQRTSDIYSLGAILYLLLTGNTPYQGWEDKQAKLAQRIPPPAPSHNIRAEAQPASETATQLRRTLSGKLDSIVLKAMHLDAKARYQSIAALSLDLRSYLTGDSVSAHHETVAGRSVKMIWRQRAAIAVLIGFLLVGGFGFWQWRQAETQKLAAAAREAELLALLDRLDKTDPADPAVPEAQKLRDLQSLQTALKTELPKVMAAQPSQSTKHEAVLERGIRYLDRYNPSVLAGAALTIELADAYLQVAALQSSVAPKPNSVATYRKAEMILTASNAAVSDERVRQRLDLARQRIVALGGQLIPATTAEPVREAAATTIEAHPPTRTASTTMAAPKTNAPPSAQILPPVAVAPAPPEPVPPASTAGGVSQDTLDRLATAEARVALANQMAEPLQRDLEARGQTLNAQTASDLQAMKSRLIRAKRQAASGEETAARESIAAVQALAERVLKTFGR